MNKPNERPILFSSPMIRAVLSGQKTQTRRVVAPRSKVWAGIALNQVEEWVYFEPGFFEAKIVDQRAQAILCPYGAAGDRLWVRETWRVEGDKPLSECVDHSDIMFAADADEVDRAIFTFRPSIFMPRWASRITLEIVSVKIERLKDISEEDAIAEGICDCGLGSEQWQIYTRKGKCRNTTRDPIHSYQTLWDSINGKTHPWDSNPWIWAVEFRPLSIGAIARQQPRSEDTGFPNVSGVFYE